MAKKQQSANYQFASAEQIRDLEEKYRTIREKLILVGQNLISSKEKSNETFIEIKKDIKILNQKMDRATDFLETISSEFSKFARKDDLNILVKQAKMFQPLELVTKQELEKIRGKK